jgi:hypothetical protein
MPDTAAPAAPQPVVQEPTKPAPVIPGSQGAAAGDATAKVETPKADDPFEFDLDVAGKPQKLKFANKDQLKAVLQKALYADQVIKDAAQAKKGAAELMEKIKTRQGLREILSDPAIGVDIKKWALDEVRDMMEDEKLTPEQREAREWRTKAEKLEAEKKAREEAEAQKIAQEKAAKQAAVIRGQIIDAMKKYPDIPQTQATMDAVIQNMRAAYRRFGKHLTPEQAMTVYSEQYWNSFVSTFSKMSDDQVRARLGNKAGNAVISKIQQLKLQELKDKTDPAKKTSENGVPAKVKKTMTEKEFDQHFSKSMGLAGL